MADNSMWFNFYISTKYNFDINNMLNIFEKIIDKLELTYNYEYMVFMKMYWQKEWMKHDELLKHKGPISEIDKDALIQIKESCNDFFWECKYKRKPVFQLGFGTNLDFFEETIRGYSISFTKFDGIYSSDFIKELAQIVKDGIGANDEILVKTDPKLHYNGDKTLYVEFKYFE